MIPLVSLMIGAYIITRMTHLIGTDNPNTDKVGSILSKIFGFITILITIYCVYVIFKADAEIPQF